MSANPKKIVNAFTAAGAKVDNIELREFTPGSMLVLQKINSPLAIKNKTGKASVQLSDLDVLRTVFILAHPSKDVYRLASESMQNFDEAVIDWADKIPMALLPELGAKLRELFARAMSTTPATSTGNPEKKSRAINVPGATSTSSPEKPAGSVGISPSSTLS